MKRAIRALTALVTILFLAGSFTAPAAAAPAAPDHSEATASAESSELAVYPPYYLLRNGNSGKCLTVRGVAANAPAVQYTCTALRDQYWSIPTPGYRDQIRNLNSNQCLVARGNANNTPVVQTPCNSGFADQIWRTISLENGRFRLLNDNSGKYLLVRGHGLDAPAVQHSLTEFPDLQWF